MGSLQRETGGAARASCLFPVTPFADATAFAEPDSAAVCLLERRVGCLRFQFRYSDASPFPTTVRHSTATYRP